MQHFRGRMTVRAVLIAYWWLVFVHVMFRIRCFGGLHGFVASFTARHRMGTCIPDIAALLSSFESARKFYIKEVRCLHLTAAATLLFRTFGFPVSMVFGV